MTAALDLDRFSKVRTLMSGGSTAGEREAAKTRAEAMARASGLTFAKACTKADAAKVKPVAPAPTSKAESFAAAMNAILNTPEARAERAERETKRQARCRELLEEYGSEDAVFADTPREAALRLACGPIIVKKAIIGGDTDTLAGWDSVGSNMPPIVRDTVSAAFPMPETVANIWAEYSSWEKRADDIAAFSPDVDDFIWVRARRYVLESKLDTLPAVTLEDVLARLSWMDKVNDQGWSRDVREEAVVLATLRADVERLHIQSGHHSHLRRAPEGVVSTTPTAERRRAVLSMLDATGLNDREIARRAGVSPSTVGSLRRKARARP